MSIKKEIVDYLLSNSGKLKDGETWYSIGVKFGIKAPDKKRAKNDKKYKKKSIARQAQRYWESYLNQKNKLELTKEIYENGQLKWETFKSHPDETELPPSEEFEVEKYTTNPYGGAWMKLRRKENFYTDKHLEDLRRILTEEITPVEYNFDYNVTEKGLFVHTSDKHLGALTKENSIYSNKYDEKEMYYRNVVKPLQLIYEHFKLFGRMDSLFLMDYGDALDGFNQKTTSGLKGTSPHTLPQQLNNREQHDMYVKLMKSLLEAIVNGEYAKDIYFIATSNSNHGGDFEYGAMRTIQEWLSVKYPFINTYVSYQPFNHFIYGEHAIVFGHGKDDEDMKQGLPLNLNEKVENYLMDYILTNKLDKYHVSVITGDLHQSSENYGKLMRYKKVLSQFGSTKWMHTNFGSGTPGLSVELFDKFSSRIFKCDDFFELDNQSNTGIDFK